ncbi:murein transglycosylase A [Aureimonas sp. AU4]|uniref:murein transglycosylase A n=1 Tax=Aureimonas sp. AU4 TaxID=1638163 RepID=UPI000781E957|nr:MltA domain-containing protein [Aureimonas sp. AU4]
MPAAPFPPGWDEGDPRPALRAFRSGPVLAGDAPARRAAEALSPDPSQLEARRFFQRFFRPAEAVDGFLTGYYEPELPASPQCVGPFQWPLYAPPPDLVRLEGAAPGLDPEARFARRRADGALEPYPDRAAIEAGLLANRGLEIAWLRSPVDRFFVHVQGSARLALPDGTSMRVGYAAKNGHRFTAIGRVLVARGELALPEADMAGIRRWLASRPLEDGLTLMRENRSFIFFRVVEGVGARQGPVGAAGLPLTPFGSLAVDPRHHPYGSLLFVSAPGLVVEGRPFRQLLVAQDTGSAIVGPGRGDLFAGSGEAAGELAGTIRHPCAFTALLPRGSERNGDDG